MLKEQPGTRTGSGLLNQYPHTAPLDKLAHAKRVCLSLALYLFAAVVLGSVRAAFAVDLFPASGATQVCIDTPLSITFNRTPQVGTSGVIRVFQLDGTLVDAIDLADPNSRKRTVGGAVSDNGTPHLFNYFPVIVTGNTAAIYLHRQLDYGQAYYVTIDPGVLLDGDYFYSADATDRPQDAGPFRPFTEKIYVSNLIVPGGSSRYAFNLRGFSPANTPIDPAHGSVTIDDAIGLVRVSDSTINGITSPTDVVQSVDLDLSNVTRNGVLLPDQ